ncbi:unnamed protein product, partial [Candidula unifasciata]
IHVYNILYFFYLEASFYGESYIFDPLQAASNDTTISFEFRTHQPQGLLFLAAGETDYVIIRLNGGGVETRLNLGSGEAVAFSARGVRLDDSQWHSVVVNHTVDTVYLEVDGAIQWQGATPGSYHDLNIDLGILLGGSGNLKKTLYKDTKSFRGCLRNVLYNGKNILEETRALESSQYAFQISWHCDAEFTASSDSPISFEHETSFVAFPHLRINAEFSTILSCQLKTRSSDAIILFNSGSGVTWEDFIAVELVAGKPKLTMNKGSGIVDVALESVVNDGKWHTLKVTVSESVVILDIDSETNLTRFHLGTQNTLNLGNHLFIGGVGVTARSSAIKLGLASLQGDSAVKGSMLGCIRNIKMNSRSYGFHDIQISRLIRAQCSWEYPCAQEPCIPSAKCTELEGSDFRCDCDQHVCVKEQFQSHSGNKNSDFSGIISVGQIEVTEGGSAVIDTNVIKIQDDFFRDALQEENVIFTVTKPAQFGIIEVGNRRGNQHSFTPRDLLSGSVSYRHYGGQSKLDSLTLEVTISSSTSEVASKLSDRYNFVLPVTIAAQPKHKLEVVLQSGNILSITSGARVRITPHVVDVRAPSVDPSLLTFVILYLRQSTSIFERSSAPRVSISSFTLKEVQDGQIWFQHNGDKMVYTKVNVTDGMLVSDAVDLRFKEDSLTINVINNTGLSVSYGVEAVITSSNLSSVTNVKLEDLELQYHITQAPEHGAVQRQEQESLEWLDIESFTQRHIDQGLLRYRHLPGTSISSYDSFQFEVMCRDVKTSTHAFSIVFKTVTLTIENNDNLILLQSPVGKFSEKMLLVVSSADKMNRKNIVYTVLRAPQKGSLYLIKRNDINVNLFDQIPALKIDSSFTQQDVNDGYVFYKLDRPSFDRVDDFTDLQASYFGFTVMVRSMIQYLPEKTPVRFINNGLKDVIEGGYSIISRQELSLEMDNFKKFTFSVVRHPAHGGINIVDPSSQAVLRHNVTTFTMSEIKEGKVAYKHDDSESKEDSFAFTAAPIMDDSEDSILGEIQEYSGTFHISMKMRNDNPPVRAFTKVFQIATGQVKHLTIKDLAFQDPDIDFDDSLLVYQRQPIANGEILSATTEEPVYNFTQEDLINGALLFQHRGDSYARTPILVTDGQFFSTSLFEIQASAPFIRILNNTGVDVQQNNYATISNENLSIETNLDFKPEDVTFRLAQEPEYGHIRARGQQVTQFNYLDLQNGLVKYWHTGGDGLEESFIVSIQLGSLNTQAQFAIRVIADGLSDPPQIIHNNILKVIALQSEVISENLLQVFHKSYKPLEIEYIITQLPLHGHLVIKGRPVKEGSAPEFTQQDIINGDIVYSSDSSEHTSDKFVFDVGTDLQSLRHLEFLIEIIPVPRQVSQVSVGVLEGGSVTLTDRNLLLRGRQLQNKKSLFKIQSPPVHGKVIVKNDKKNMHVSSFTIEDLVQGQVTYLHDGSESLYDELTLKDDNTGQRYHIIINVTSVNDQPPYVTVNTGLDVWSGSVSLLTGEHLKFRVAAPSNGHLAFLNNTFKQISVFTQLDLDSGRVVFVHKGDEQGEFRFQATDGANKDEFRVFRIRARPVQITVPVNNTLKAFPNTLQPINNATLMAVTSAANYSHPVVFSVVEPKPQKGRLVTLIDKRVVDLNSFTQDEINEGKVFFQHDGTLRNWRETETIYFEITATYGQAVTGRALIIDISFANLNEGNYRKLFNMNFISVEEGKKVTITRSHFDSTELVQKIRKFEPNVNIVFSFVSSVRHGYLWFKDRDLEIDEEFTQDDINTGALVYKHDHSDSRQDWFQFAVKLLIPRTHLEASNSVAKILNFSIAVEPVNDQGFELVTRHPRIKVKQGSEIKVTAHNLTTVDLDTGPEGVEYKIVTQPANGMLVRLPYDRTRLQTFTQKDINDGLIVFKHDGTRATSGSLHFQVWDGKFEPWRATLEITVIPLMIEVAQDRHVPLLQGQNYIALSNQHLKISTNGDLNALKYTVTQAPQFGKLMKYSSVVTHFTQADINGGQLLYTQDEDSPGDDFFVCDIDHTSLDCSLKTVQFDVIMKPRVKQRPLITAPGTHVAITRSSLDASELAQITNDNPQFTVLTAPLHGRIMRRHRQRRQTTLENTFQPVSNFTFEDIVYTKIYYVPNPDRHNSGDKFIYLLEARGVPPARGEFLIQLDTQDNNPGGENGQIGQTDSDKTDGTSSNPDGNMPDNKSGELDDDLVASSVDSSPDDNNNNVVIAVVLSLVFVVIILVVIVILFIRWRRRNQAAVRETKPNKPRPYISGPLQLEQPHVQIEAKHEALGSPCSADNVVLVSRYMEEDQCANATNAEVDSLRRVNLRCSSPSPDVTKLDYNSQSDQISEDMERRSTMTSGRGSDASADLLDWTLMDPDILQQCRITTPVLRNNQYWL